jgi:hypothetical protein
LGRANFGADAAGGAAIYFFSVHFVIDEEGDEAKFFGDGELFFGVLNGEDALRVFAGAMFDAFAGVVAFAEPFDIVYIGIDEAFECDA